MKISSQYESCIFDHMVCGLIDIFSNISKISHWPTRDESTQLLSMAFKPNLMNSYSKQKSAMKAGSRLMSRLTQYQI